MLPVPPFASKFTDTLPSGMLDFAVKSIASTSGCEFDTLLTKFSSSNEHTCSFNLYDLSFGMPSNEISCSISLPLFCSNDSNLSSPTAFARHRSDEDVSLSTVVKVFSFTSLPMVLFTFILRPGCMVV